MGWGTVRTTDDTGLVSALSAPEMDELARCESVIEAGLKTFVEVGLALLAIRDQRLYREWYGTFEDYCRERWDMGRAHAYRLMDAADVVQNLSPIGDMLPATESQARPLAALAPDEQREVWREVVQTAPETGITAKHIELTINKTWAYRTQFTHEYEWYTPKVYIEAAREAMGGIDLDPASCLAAQQTVRATHFYTHEDDGLLQPWYGRIWLNPPYVQPTIEQFIDKLLGEWLSGHVTQAILLTNNSTDTRWFHHAEAMAEVVCFTKGRIAFVHPEKAEPSPTQGQAFFYFGQEWRRFVRVFSALGFIR